MFHFIILDVGDEDRVEDYSYANIVDFQTFDDVSEANAKCDEMTDRYLEEYIECDEEDYNEEDYLKSLYVDNEKTFRNFLLTFESCTRQLMVIKGDR